MHRWVALERLHHVFSSRQFTTTRENRTRKHKEVDMDIECDTLLQQYTYMSTCRRFPSIQVVACTFAFKFMKTFTSAWISIVSLVFGGQGDSKPKNKKIQSPLREN
jgi:hypothetical protein